jgi:hypothetical protein
MNEPTPTPTSLPTDFSAASLGVKRLALALAFIPTVLGCITFLGAEEARDQKLALACFAWAMGVWLLIRGIDWIIRGFTKASK